MKKSELAKQLRCMAINTGTLNCLGCGHEQSCGIHGCKILREAADNLEPQSPPVTRAEWIQRASIDELAIFLVKIADNEKEMNYCRNLKECTDAVGEDEEIPIERCIGCMKVWLQKRL